MAGESTDAGWVGYGPWSREALMLAELADRLDRVVYALIRVNGGKVPAPTPYPRPGVVPKNAGTTDPRVVDYLTKFRERMNASKTASAAATPPPAA